MFGAAVVKVDGLEIETAFWIPDPVEGSFQDRPNDVVTAPEEVPEP